MNSGKRKFLPRPKKSISDAMNAYCYFKANRDKIKQDIRIYRSSLSSLHSDLDELKPIRFKDMVMFKENKGVSLRCRVVAEPYLETLLLDTEGIPMPTVFVLVEDEDGQGELLLLMNYMPQNIADPNELLPVNTVLVIKEPLLFCSPWALETTCIHVESPTDVLVLNEHDVEKWKDKSTGDAYEQLNEMGNKRFVAKKYMEAVQLYSKALKLKKTAKTYNNRAAAYLELDMFNEAFLDAQESSRIEPNEKAYFRMGRAMYEMRQFGQAVDEYRKCLALNSDNQRAREELERSERRVRESETGEYDMKKLVEDVRAGKLRLDVADYVSKSIRIEEVSGKRNRLVASADIKRGELLCASKAISIAYEKECHFDNNVHDLCIQNVIQLVFDQSTTNLFFKMQHDPYLFKKVYQYRFDRSDFKEMGINKKETQPGIVDLRRIFPTTTSTTFRTEDLRVSACKTMTFQPEESPCIKAYYSMNIGHWIEPSFLSPSCMPNAQRIYLNDFVTYYALRDIKKGELITSVNGNGMADKRNIYRGWRRDPNAPRCDCEFCEMERKDLNYKNRVRLLAESRKALGTSDKPLSENGFSKIVETIRATYKPGQPYQYQLYSALFDLLRWYMMNGEREEKMAECSMQMFESLRDCSFEYLNACMCIANVAKYYWDAGMREEARETLEIAKKFFIGSIEHYNYGLDFDKLEAGVTSNTFKY